VVVGPRGLRSGRIELKERRTGAREELSVETFFARLAG
jgi:prolyl-tRNA synthetase